MKFRGSYFSYLLVLLSFYFSMGIFVSMLSVYLDGIGKTPGDISLIVSASAIFALGMIPLVSYFHDKSGRPHMVNILVLALSASAGLAFAFFRQTWILFILNGLSISLILSVAPICEKLCASGKFKYSSVRVWGAVGFALAAQTAGIVYQYVSPTLLFVLFAVSMTITIIGFWGVKEVYSEKQNQAKPEAKEKNSMFWLNRNFLLFLLVTFIFAGATGLNNTYIPMLMVERGQSVSLTGTVIFFGTLMEIPLILASAKFMDKLNAKTLLIAAFSLLTVQFLIYGLTDTYTPVMFSVILFRSVATMLFIMITVKVVVSIVDECYTVSALGLTATINSLGSIIFQNAGGRFVDVSSISQMFLVLVAFSALGLVISLTLRIKKSNAIFQ